MQLTGLIIQVKITEHLLNNFFVDDYPIDP